MIKSVKMLRLDAIATVTRAQASYSQCLGGQGNTTHCINGCFSLWAENVFIGMFFVARKSHSGAMKIPNEQFQSRYVNRRAVFVRLVTHWHLQIAYMQIKHLTSFYEYSRLIVNCDEYETWSNLTLDLEWPQAQVWITLVCLIYHCILSILHHKILGYSHHFLKKHRIWPLTVIS